MPSAGLRGPFDGLLFLRPGPSTCFHWMAVYTIRFGGTYYIPEEESKEEEKVTKDKDERSQR